MATYIDNIVKFHTFSKSPVSKDTTLGGAVNPSGHTVTTSQVRAQDIPAFLNTFQGTKEQAITWLGTNYPTPAHNDIVFYGGEFKAGFSTPKCLKWNAKLETPAWEDFDITAATTLKNADDKDVIAVHQNLETVFVDGSNNAATNSNRNSLFVKRADGSILDHFVASTDKIVAGMPSLGYNALVLWNGGAIDEGELDANYIGNTFAGIVHLNKQYSTGDDAKFKVTCFEYIGEKLTASLTELAKKVESVTATAGEGVQAVTDTATTAGLSVSTKEITVEGQTDPVTVKALDIDVAEVSAQGVITSGDEAKLVTATGAQNIAKKEASAAITDAVADGSVIDTRIDEVITAATLADGEKIATTTDTTKLVTVEDVTTYVSENAKVTLTQGTGITVTPNGEASTAFTVAVDDTIATAKSVTDLEQKVNDHLLDAAGKLEICVLADKLPKKPFFEDENFYVKSYGFEWEKLSNNIYPNKFEVKVAQSVDGLNEFKVNDVVLTPSPLAAQTCKLVVYSIDDDKQLTEVAVSQANTFDASTSIYAFKFDNQISLSAGARYRFCFRNNDETNALNCLPVIMNSCAGAEIAKNEMINRYITGETEDDYWGCWATPAGVLNDVPQYTYGPKVSISGLTPTPNEDGKALIGENGKIYLIPNTGSENQNVYDEFVWTNDTWEKIGSTKVDLTGYINSIADANGVSGVVTGNEVEITVQDGNTTQKGIVQLASTHEAADTTKAATGATVAAAISGIAEANKSDNGVTVTTAGGSVTGVTVNTTSLVSEDALVESVTGDNLITAADALAAIKLAKPENYIESVTVGSITTNGETALTINDGRTTVYPNDLWGTTVSMVGDTITVQGGPIDGTEWGPKNGYNTKSYININGTSYPQGSNPITKVENNMVYNETTEVANIKINELVNGSYMFTNTSLNSFSGDLSSLINGSFMFCGTSITSFSGDLSSLVNGYNMFSENNSFESFSGDLSSLVNGYRMFFSTSITSFSGDLSSLVNGYMMFMFNFSFASFSGDLSNLVDGEGMLAYTSLTSFSGDLNSLVNGKGMFSNNNSFESFNGDLSNLVDGEGMFNSSPLESFNGDLSSLVNGSMMFDNTRLDVESVELICDVLPNYNTENGGKTLQTATWNESGENKGKYTYSDWESGDYNYPIVKIEAVSDTMSQGNADGIRRVFGTKEISESNVKTISITWSDISVLSEADRTAITKLFTDTATEKGWTFITNEELGGNVSPNAVMTTDGTIQYYILAKKDEATEDNATHIDASGKLWKFDTAEAIIGPNIKYWSMFATVEDALTEWELTPWTKPTEEETEA